MTFFAWSHQWTLYDWLGAIGLLCLACSAVVFYLGVTIERGE